MNNQQTHTRQDGRKVLPASLFSSLCLPLLLLYCMLLGACAGKDTSPPPVPHVALETEGPKFAIAGQYAGMALQGEMDRSCMVGFGHMTLAATDPAKGFTCEGDIDAPPTDKGRIRGMLQCGPKRAVLISLRNTGPDQGVGIGKENTDGEMMVIFYHPSREEAERRLPQVIADMERARQAKKK